MALFKASNVLICFIILAFVLPYCHAQNSQTDYLNTHNSARSQGSGSFMTGTAAVNLWVGENPYYDYNSNSCTGGKECRHYTQVVWKNSIQLGRARVQCTNGWWFVTCNYNPPGNYIGQRPY
ncbi:hypothetical protein H5410_010522 [Solanum commersonii]|uniref:SCP domain-containing protein n=1 Tax=Solanum commersonii TaxID=4109 RepID=A0A9J6AKX6_SOLCO|nr:hypothetical protein H5410_010522 [Solanum commersonii]